MNKLYPKNQINFIEEILRYLFLKSFQSLYFKSSMVTIHFAGLKSVSNLSAKNEYWDVNVNGTKNLLKVMEENKCFKIVFSSSASVYSQEVISPIGKVQKWKQIILMERQN